MNPAPPVTRTLRITIFFILPFQSKEIGAYMKKVIAGSLLCLGCLSSGLFSLPSGNPATPNMVKEGFFIDPSCVMNVRAGYEGNFVWDRNEKAEGEKIDEYKIDWNAGSLTGNFWNRLDLFCVLGEARFQGNWRIEPTPPIVSQIAFESKYGFLWGAGGRALFYEWKSFSWGFHGRYMQAKPTLLWMTKDGTPLTVGNAKAAYKEWQLDSSISYKVDFLIPYLGIVFAKSTSNIFEIPSDSISNDNTGHLYMKSRKPLGVLVGCSLTQGKMFFLNLEIRFVTEEAFDVTADFRF
jgi:hypothetical protein